MKHLGLVMIMLIQIPAVAQQQNYTVPRTAWGDPDIEGVYTFAPLTPFQRPAAQAGKDVLTEEETKALEEQLKKKQAEIAAIEAKFGEA